MFWTHGVKHQLGLDIPAVEGACHVSSILAGHENLNDKMLLTEETGTEVLRKLKA